MNTQPRLLREIELESDTPISSYNENQSIPTIDAGKVFEEIDKLLEDHFIKSYGGKTPMQFVKDGMGFTSLEMIKFAKDFFIQYCNQQPVSVVNHEEVARKIVEELANYVEDSFFHNYGLPISNKPAMKKMLEIVKNNLKQITGNPTE